MEKLSSDLQTLSSSPEHLFRPVLREKLSQSLPCPTCCVPRRPTVQSWGAEGGQGMSSYRHFWHAQPPHLAQGPSFPAGFRDSYWFLN